MPVERSAYSSNTELDIIEEEEDDIDDDSGVYRGSSGGRATTSYPNTRSQKGENTESELIVRLFLGQYLLLELLVYS